jgi:H+-transporting ATPase
MGGITAAWMILGVCKLGFSTAVLAFGKYRLGLGQGELQTLAFVTIVFGAQAVLYVVRERRHLWSSRPGAWILAASAVDIGLVAALAGSGTLTAPLPGRLLATVFVATIGLALVLDQVKRPVMAVFRVG